MLQIKNKLFKCWQLFNCISLATVKKLVSMHFNLVDGLQNKLQSLTKIVMSVDFPKLYFILTNKCVIVYFIKLN